MKTLMLLLLGSALLATSAFAGVNIQINPFEIAQIIHAATQSMPGQVYQSKPAATSPAQKKRPKSRSSHRPSLAAASNQSSAVVSTSAERSQSPGSASEKFAGFPSSKTVSESATPSESPVGNVNESPTQAAGIAAASTPAASSNAAETATAALESTPAATPPSAISWREVDAIYNLRSHYTDLQKDEEWKRYKGQRVKWVGRVEEIKEGWLGGLSLMVKMNNSTVTFDLMIDLKDEQKATAMRVHKGQIIRFTGTLDTWGSLLPITISDGEIINQ